MTFLISLMRYDPINLHCIPGTGDAERAGIKL